MPCFVEVDQDVWTLFLTVKRKDKKRQN